MAYEARGNTQKISLTKFLVSQYSSFKFLFYVFGCFDCMYVHVPYMYLVPFWRSEEGTGPLGTGVTNCLSIHVGARTQTLWERAFTLSRLSSPIFSSFYYQFDALLRGSWLVMTTRKIKFKDFTPNYLGSQARKLTSQQGHFLGGDY